MQKITKATINKMDITASANGPKSLKDKESLFFSDIEDKIQKTITYITTNATTILPLLT